MLQSKTHSIMFHHFHGIKHKPAQGSINASTFRKILHWLMAKYTLNGALEYKEKFENGKLKDDDICLSFDDALKCQYDIAVPVLNDFGIDAYFFVYSSAFTTDPDPLEIYRLFRTSNFDHVDDFYKVFFEKLKNRDSLKFEEHQNFFKNLNYLSDRKYYSQNDKWFRYIRDQYLTKLEYKNIMKEMMLKKNFDIDAAKKNLWMSEKDLTNLSEMGHTIGLHSYSHPTQMTKLSKSDQFLEYSKNLQHLKHILGKAPKTMSHPCGNYNKNTLKVLNSLGIKMGFKSNMPIGQIDSPLEIPRENHANILVKMKHENNNIFE